jgi:hypothetical protein
MLIGLVPLVLGRKIDCFCPNANGLGKLARRARTTRFSGKAWTFVTILETEAPYGNVGKYVKCNK